MSFDATVVHPPHLSPGTRKQKWLALATLLNCGFQIAWFSAKCFNDINFDGIDYLGIARHVRAGELRASINAFRSPLVSWLIAGLALSRTNLFVLGKIFAIACFLASVVLTYTLTLRLWHSKLVAALAALLFSLGRGFIGASVFAIGPDFLLTALVLIYFLLLLRCLRGDRTRDWLLLGFIHALAYLAKAIALPWLAISSVAVALCFSNRDWKRPGVRMLLAFLAPFIVASAWSMVLHSRYGIFSTGSQFKTNLLQWTLHEKWGAGTGGRENSSRENSSVANSSAANSGASNLGLAEKHYLLLRDTSGFVDGYMVTDPMPPGSYPWRYPLVTSRLVPAILRSEVKNLPLAAKELVITTTVGGLLAFFLIFTSLFRNRAQLAVEFWFALIVAASAISLILAYSMLVFDGRYIFPLIPLLLSLGARALYREGHDDSFHNGPWLRRSAQILLVIGVAFSLTYRASPFRTMARDHQLSCIAAGRNLRFQPGSTVVSIGTGPWPEYGVGWEAGYISAFWGNRRMIATLDHLPDPGHVESLMKDLKESAAENVLVWGKPADADYSNQCQRIREEKTFARAIAIQDPYLGEVGTIFLTEE